MADIRQSGAILDDFQRADESPLSFGGKWSNPDTAWAPLKLASNVAQETSDPFCWSYWNPFSMTGDEAEVWACTVGGNSPAIAWGFHLFVTSSVGGANTSDGYFWRMETTTAGGRTRMYRLTNNSATLLQNNDDNPPTGGDWIGLIRRVGTTLEGWASIDDGANWTQYLSVSDGTYTGDMYGGISCTSTLVGFTCFGAGPRETHRTQIYRVLRGLQEGQPE